MTPFPTKEQIQAHTHTHTRTQKNVLFFPLLKKLGAEEDLVWSMKERDGCLVPWQWNRDYFALENRFFLLFFFDSSVFSQAAKSCHWGWEAHLEENEPLSRVECLLSAAAAWTVCFALRASQDANTHICLERLHNHGVCVHVCVFTSLYKIRVTGCTLGLVGTDISNKAMCKDV